MSYTPTVWQNGDVITAEKLNKLENGVAGAGNLVKFTIANGEGVLPYDVPTIGPKHDWDIGGNVNPIYNVEKDRVATIEELLSLDANSMAIYLTDYGDDAYVIPFSKTVDITFNPDNVQEGQVICVLFDYCYVDDGSLSYNTAGWYLTVTGGVS